MAAASLIAPRQLGDTVGSAGWAAFLVLVTFGLPLAIGMAILRHRLYDIDVVINRTLVYGALTVTLGATYLGLVLLVGLAVGQSGLAAAVEPLVDDRLDAPERGPEQRGDGERRDRHQIGRAHV